MSGGAAPLASAPGAGAAGGGNFIGGPFFCLLDINPPDCNFGTTGADATSRAGGRTFGGSCIPAGRPPTTGDLGMTGTDPVEAVAETGGFGAPCLDKWNALIFACKSDGTPPACAPPRPDRALDKLGGLGRLAFCSRPRCVDDAVIEEVESGSEMDRMAGKVGGREEAVD